MPPPSKSALVRTICALVLGLAALSLPGHAAEPPEEKTAQCGSYSFTVPADYILLDMPQPYAGRIYINRRDRHAYSPGRRGLTCISIPKTEEANFRLKSGGPVISSTPQIKADSTCYLSKNDALSSDFRRFYHLKHWPNETDVANFDRCLVELAAKDSPEHVILHFWDETCLPRPKSGPRDYKHAAAEKKRREKEQVLRIMLSIHKTAEEALPNAASQDGADAKTPPSPWDRTCVFGSGQAPLGRQWVLNELYDKSAASFRFKPELMIVQANSDVLLVQLEKVQGLYWLEFSCAKDPSRPPKVKYPRPRELNTPLGRALASPKWRLSGDVLELLQGGKVQARFIPKDVRQPK